MTNQKSAHHLLPIFAVLLAASLGASSGLYIKGLVLSGFALGGFRMGVPLLLSAATLFRSDSRRRLWQKRGPLLVASGINAVRMLLFIFAFKLAPLGSSTILLYTWPVFALIVDAVDKRSWPGLRKIALIGLAFSGVLIMNLHRRFSWGENELIGAGLMICSAFLFSITQVIFKKALADAKETEIVFSQNAVGGLVMLPFVLMEIPSVPLLENMLGIVYGLSVGLCGFWLFFYAMKRLPLFEYSTLAYAEVAVAVVFGMVFLHEALVVNQIVGAACILLSSLLAQYGRVHLQK